VPSNVISAVWSASISGWASKICQLLTDLVKLSVGWSSDGHLAAHLVERGVRWSEGFLLIIEGYSNRWFGFGKNSIHIALGAGTLGKGLQYDAVCQSRRENGPGQAF